MPQIQCKMCGGGLMLPEGAASGTCEYCGSLVTFPRLAGEQLENLYNRAEHFRRMNDYDRAAATYEKMIETDPEDPEAYWGLVLCRYGIEYVKDPATGEHIPTCHRVSYDSILADADYLAALEKAGGAERSIYEAEAKRIAEIQKDILAISAQEEPFDVFICYKESDDKGRRTRDSVAAQEIYYELTEQGYKVFFARITLEKKLGQQYEPYIFAALNSAKVMLVVGDKPEHFNAVWVRNEWSRYLSLMKKDRKKLLIPCYRDMDAYDLPEELAMFQAQDMGRIGFIQDLLHGIAKVVKTAPAVAPAPAAGGSENPLLLRAELFVENGEFDKAVQYCERVLDAEPYNGRAYFCRLMAEKKVSDEAKLAEVYKLTEDKNFALARKFATPELAEKLDRIEAEIAHLGSEKAAEIAAAEARRQAEKAAEEAREADMGSSKLNIYDSVLVEVEDKNIREAIIPNSVRIIDEGVFRSCSKLESVVIPDSVEEIGNDAFKDCVSLRSVVIPDSVKSIGWYAFKNCRSLQSVVISASVLWIAENTFEGCTGLRSVIIPDSVKKIESRAFSGCTNLQEVTLGPATRIIGNAFKGTPCERRILAERRAQIVNPLFDACGGPVGCCLMFVAAVGLLVFFILIFG